VETRVRNQRDEPVMTFRRTALLPRRNHATLGEGRLPCDGPGTSPPEAR
jgi:hypothetical protein